MNDLVSSQSLERPGYRSARWLKIVGVVVLVLGGLASLAYHELRTSAIQSWLLSRYAARLSYEVKPGPSASIAFPRGGPFDTERGHGALRAVGRHPALSRAGGGGTGHPRLRRRAALRRAAARCTLRELR